MTDGPFQLVDTFLEHWRTLPREEGAHMPHVRTFLDIVEPALQPHVALVDIHARDDWTLRLYGTAPVNAFGRDLSGINPLEIYAPDIRPLMMDSIGAVISHPCGWKSMREITTTTGLTNPGSGVTLPLATDPEQAPCIVNFVIMAEPVAHKDRVGIVDSIMSWEWMDIGAGVPEP